MAKTNNPFAGLLLNRDLIPEAIGSIGGMGYQLADAGTQKHLIFTFKGQPYRMSAFYNNDGKTTLSCQQGYAKDVFSEVALAIQKYCSLGNGGAVEISIPRFPAEDLDELLGYLEEIGASCIQDDSTQGYRLLRLRGRQGDMLTLKVYANGTLQLQGRRAMLAAEVLDMLSTGLDYEAAVNAQIELFKVPLGIKVVQDELEGKWAAAFAHSPSQVKAQLTSALALTKVDIELSDYTPIAFPALRGLEGVMKYELHQAGLEVQKVTSFGEYFEQFPEGMRNYRLKPLVASTVGEPLASEVAKCYTVYNNARHGLAHMGVSLVDTRMLPALGDARTIVFSTFDIIDGFYRSIRQ